MATPVQQRAILSEIPDRSGRVRLATTPTRMLADEPIAPNNILNNTLGNDPLSYLQPVIPSPDEIIIRQRGRRRRVKLNWSPNKCPVSSRCPFQKTPTKSSSIAMTLRSSPRKKLLDGLSYHTTPEKANKPSPLKLTPDTIARTPRTSTTPLLKRLMLDEVASTPDLKRQCSDPGTPLESSLEEADTSLISDSRIETRLNLLSHKQLVNVVLTMIKEDPKMEPLVVKTAPKPDLSHYYDELKQIVRQILRSFPKSSSSRYRSSPIYPRVAAHIKEFKETLVTQCSRLYKASQWEILMDYHKMAWQLVRSLPVWDHAKYNGTREQCFKFLCTMISASLKNIGLRMGVGKLEEIEKVLRVEMIDSREVCSVVSEVKEILNNIV